MSEIGAERDCVTVYGELFTFDNPGITSRRVLFPVCINGADLPAWLYVVGNRWTGSFKELTGGIWR